MTATTLTGADAYAWHVSSVRAGMGDRPNVFVHHVQRYRRPEEAGRYTGETADRTWPTEAEAQAAADLANAGRPPFGFRGTYL